MTHLEDTRPIVSSSPYWPPRGTRPEPDTYQAAEVAELLMQLLARNPRTELASLRLVEGDHGRYHWFGRVGKLTAAVCDCYPGGFSPETYEGPQHHCSVHGHGNDLAPSECPACIAERECPSCHTTAGHPHTEYCQHDPPVFECGCPTSNIQSHGCTAPDLHRPDDDPAPVPTCDGRDCGGYPHE